MSEPTMSRTQRDDFQATTDPALMDSADRGHSELLDYRQLYQLWERQQWRTQDLDFSQDRIDWHERIPAEERYQRMYGLSSFFLGEQRVAAELGPMMRAAPTEDMRIFLCTQIADEARHALSSTASTQKSECSRQTISTIGSPRRRLTPTRAS